MKFFGTVLAKTKRILAIVLVLAMLPIGSTFSQAASKKLTPFERASTNRRNLMLEDFMPADSFYVAAFNNLSEQERDELVSLLKLFPRVPGNDVWNKIRRGDFWGVVDMSLKEAVPEADQYELLDQVKDFLGEDYRIAFGMGEIDFAELDAYASYADAPIYFAFTAEKPKLFENLIIEESNPQRVIFHKGGTMLEVDEETTWLIYRNMVVLTTSLAQAKAALDRADKETGLRYADEYRERIQKMEAPYLMYFYIKLEGFLAQMSELGDEFAGSEFSLLLEAMKDEVFVVLVEEDGMRLQFAVGMDDEKLDEAGFDFESLKMVEPYLVDLVPGEGMILYQEGFNLAASLEMNLQMYEELEEAEVEEEEGVEELDLEEVLIEPEVLELEEEVELEDAEGESGEVEAIDYDYDASYYDDYDPGYSYSRSYYGVDYRDLLEVMEEVAKWAERYSILEWLDKGYAMALQRSEDSLLPSLTLVVDASSDPESAEQLLELGAGMLMTWADNMQMIMGLEKSWLTAGQVEMKEGSLKVLELNLAQVLSLYPGEKDLLEFLMMEDQVLELYYGVLDGKLIVSTYPKFPEQYGVRPFSGTADYQEFLKRGVGNQSIAYYDLGEVWSMTEDYFTLLDYFGGGADALGIDKDQIMSFLEPFKGVFMSSEYQEGSLWADIFVKMNNLPVEGRL